LKGHAAHATLFDSDDIAGKEAQRRRLHLGKNNEMDKDELDRL
jgi:hypothetical protein